MVYTDVTNTDNLQSHILALRAAADTRSLACFRRLALPCHVNVIVLLGRQALVQGRKGRDIRTLLQQLPRVAKLLQPARVQHRHGVKAVQS